MVENFSKDSGIGYDAVSSKEVNIYPNLFKFTEESGLSMYLPVGIGALYLMFVFLSLWFWDHIIKKHIITDPTSS